MTARVTLLPSARRLIDSLRDIGYDLPAAIADIVDNSIAADANRIDISFRFLGLQSHIAIADNGRGMSPAVLEEAMRYGTRRAYDPAELGRYGLGLKTASLSQCRCLTVASRQGLTRRRIAVLQWDLDVVLRSDRWEVARLTPEAFPPELIGPLEGGPGTVVMWEGLDRVLDYRIPDGVAAEKGFMALAQEVREHLAMVFHRFLAGDVKGKRKLRMTLNGVPIAAWDPYARSEPHTRALAPQSITFEVRGRRRRLHVRPYLLPPQQQFSSAAAHAVAAGPQRWNRQQGFYFYRSDRLVQAGGWCRLRTVDEHTKLARVAVDIPAGSEDIFGLNVSKMRVAIPRSLRSELLAIASGVAAEATSQYRRTSNGVRSLSSLTGASVLSTPLRLVDQLAHEERDLLRVVAALLREELTAEPDLLRKVLRRIDALGADEAAAILSNSEHVNTLDGHRRALSPSGAGELTGAAAVPLTS